MAPVIIKWLIVAMSLLSSGYMAFDGLRAIATGDYIRPETGEHAGQLGPWTKIAEKVGLNPMSGLMKSIFAVFGITGIFITICFAMDLSWAWKAMVIFNICCGWNLYFGTASSIVQLVLLFILRMIR